MSRRLQILAAVSLLSLGVAGCDENLLNPMHGEQPKVKAYEPSAFFEDGLAMRKPPAGTVPRDRITLNDKLLKGKVTGPDGNDLYVTKVPLTVDTELMKRGQERFDIYCATCHGALGDGKSIVATQMALRPPPSLVEYRDRPIGYVYDVITNGFGLMASYEAQLPVEDRWAVVAYVRALQISQSQTVSDIPPEERTRLEAAAKEMVQ